MNFPSGLPKCPLCESKLDSISNAEPDPDWPEEVERRKHELKDAVETGENDLVKWRRDQLRRMGFADELHVEMLADLVDVPIHEVSDAIRRGCSPENALAIFA